MLQIDFTILHHDTEMVHFDVLSYQENTITILQLITFLKRKRHKQ